MATKADICNAIADHTEGVTKKAIGEIVDHVFGIIGDHLAKGDKVSIAGFGSFTVSKRAARQGRNPATGESIKIAASKAARFKPGKELKEKVNG